MTPDTRSLIFSGIRRSGNHAIIDWVLHNSKRPAVHYNDCSPQSADPTTAFAQVKVLGLPFLRCKPAVAAFVRRGGWRERTHRFVQSDPILQINYIRSQPLATIVASVEDCNADTFRQWVAAVQEHATGSHWQPVIVVRDIYNLYASLRAASMIEEKDAHLLVALWLDNVEAALESEDIVLAVYNRWLQDHFYRCDLAERLGLARVSNPLKRASKEGGGSSFGGPVDEQSLFSRWRKFRHEEGFREIADNKHVASLCQHLLGTPAGLEELLATR